MNVKPRICAVAMFKPIYDIQLQSLMNVFTQKNINVIKTTSYQNRITKFLDVLFFLPYNRNNYNVIHVQAHSYYSIIYLIVTLFWAKVLNKLIIVMYYGGAAREFFSNYPRMITFLFKNVNRTIVASEYVRFAFKELDLNTILIPHILEVSNWVFRNRIKPGHNLLWVRNLSNEYNPLMLLDVFKLIKSRDSRYSLKIVGTGNLKDIMKMYIKENSLSDVEMVGRVSDSELRLLFNWSDIFINTTNVDNQPVSVLEAMACGVPVVSTNPGGIPEIITHKENGLLSNPGDVSAMVQNINLFINDPQLVEKLSIQGRSFVEKKFNSNVIYEQWKNVYANLGFVI